VIHHPISLMLMLPVIGAVLQVFLGRESLSPVPHAQTGTASVVADWKTSTARWVALATSVGSALFGIVLVGAMSHEASGPQWTETLSWVGSYAISYSLALDGLSAPIVILISIVFPLLIAAEWTRARGRRGLHGMLLLLQAAFIGAVCAQDVFLLFFFWAFSSLPIYFLVGIWGGKDRETAAFRGIVTASLGNSLFFGSLLVVYYSSNPHTFSLTDLAKVGLGGVSFEVFGRTISAQSLAFFLMTAGLALRAPIWPVHNWFTQLASSAPAVVLVAVIISAVAVAPSVFMRLSLSLFPATFSAVSDSIVTVGVVNLVMGGVCALAQKSLRGLLSFVALSELGFLLIGVGTRSPAGSVGAVYQQMVVGLALAAFGLLIGVISERTEIEEFGPSTSTEKVTVLGGLALRAPGAALVAAVAAASILGVPGLAGFISHALLVIGGYSAHLSVVTACGAALILGTYTVLNMYRHVFLGQVTAETERFGDLQVREKLYLAPLVISLIGFGIYPKPLLDIIRPTVMSLLSVIK
jgi:NADH-quinone oxidoreductase subunit M